MALKTAIVVTSISITLLVIYGFAAQRGIDNGYESCGNPIAIELSKEVDELRSKYLYQKSIYEQEVQQYESDPNPSESSYNQLNDHYDRLHELRLVFDSKARVLDSMIDNGELFKC